MDDNPPTLREQEIQTKNNTNADIVTAFLFQPLKMARPMFWPW